MSSRMVDHPPLPVPNLLVARWPTARMEKGPELPDFYEGERWWSSSGFQQPFTRFSMLLLCAVHITHACYTLVVISITFIGKEKGMLL
uniref:Uncharacterized protein n=1 Tax=Aegilops tauschii subsp. strangulata TaxID=200361 RepID=A0A453DQI4_AEGTS